jgi:hypothetical protein
MGTEKAVWVRARDAGAPQRARAETSELTGPSWLVFSVGGYSRKAMDRLPPDLAEVVAKLRKGLEELYVGRFRDLLLYGSYARETSAGSVPPPSYGTTTSNSGSSSSKCRLLRVKMRVAPPLRALAAIRAS